LGSHPQGNGAIRRYNTLAALLALNFPEAGPNEIEVLMYAALVLMFITLLVNVLGSMIMLYAQRGNK
jgi:phosphate transport system permease protein